MKADPKRPLGPDDHIDLRCPKCGEMRTPIVLNKYLPEDMIAVICEECRRRSLLGQPLSLKEDKEPPRYWSFRSWGY